ncbi:MAG: hypothetical protein LBH66_09020 [Oscillospiraceae bacterium]|nr:hypothetical protein [Oscillospiraceae bacterium]
MLTEQFNLDDALSARHVDGKDEGIQIGEAKHARKMASILRDYGVDMEIIINTTGLTEEEINQL